MNSKNTTPNGHPVRRRLLLYTREILALMVLAIAWLMYSVVLANASPLMTLNYNRWDLAYEEEFDNPQALANFDTRYIWPRKTIINKEAQYYVDPAAGGYQPFDVTGGILSITADKTPENQRAAAEDQPYLSGVLTSRSNGHSQLYGLFEARMKLPKARGAWPAFWLLPTFDQWPSGIAVLSELDVMEAVGDVGSGVYHTSMHTNQSGKLVSASETVSTNANLTDEFHTYSIWWGEFETIWFFNGQEVMRRATPDDMHEPRHFLLNLAVGGKWAGEPNEADYPASLEVDYVRAYTRKPQYTPAPLEASSAKTVTEETPLTWEGIIRLFERARDVARGSYEG